jgi:hypothetical protein
VISPEHTIVEARTGFGAILHRAVESTPGAVGGAFADRDGEMVDCYADGVTSLDLAILTAHYGVIMAHLDAALGVWHYGGPECFIAQHASLGIVVHAVTDGYYALLVVAEPTAARGHEPWHDRMHGAVASLREAARELRREMA